MRKITPSIIEKLLMKNPNKPAITLYMPTHKLSNPPAITEDITRFKNLSNKIIKELENHDKHSSLLAEFRTKSEELQSDRDFWKYMDDSLLICASKEAFEYYSLPFDTEEFSFVGDHYYLAPLIGMSNEFKQSYVLALSMKNPKLYLSDAYELTGTDVELPKSIEDALNIDEMHLRSLQFSSVDGPKGAQFHGHGAAKDTGYDDAMKFLRIIDHTINENIPRELPLILAGVPSELSSYRQISTYPDLLKKQIELEINTVDNKILHEKSREILSNASDKAQRALLKRYKEMGSAPDQISSELKEIKSAAKAGRVQSLMLNLRELTHDTVKDRFVQVNKLSFPKGKYTALLDSIARDVAAKGGEIINVSEKYMPGSSMAASIYRY